MGEKRCKDCVWYDLAYLGNCGNPDKKWPKWKTHHSINREAGNACELYKRKRWKFWRPK